MKKLLLFVMTFSLVTLMFAVPAKALVIGSPVSYNGHDYYLLDAKPWVSQEAEAVGLGGHLVTINDAAENTFVWNTFGLPDIGLFIGFNDIDSEGNWVWTSGEAVTYTNWRLGEPNNLVLVASSHPGEHVLELGGDYRWNDVNPIWEWRAVVEVVPASVPEPSTLLLFGSGIAGLGFWRMRKGKV